MAHLGISRLRFFKKALPDFTGKGEVLLESTF